MRKLIELVEQGAKIFKFMGFELLTVFGKIIFMSRNFKNLCLKNRLPPHLILIKNFIRKQVFNN